MGWSHLLRLENVVPVSLHYLSKGRKPVSFETRRSYIQFIIGILVGSGYSHVLSRAV